MRILTETEMPAVTGGPEPMTGPESRPCWEPPEFPCIDDLPELHPADSRHTLLTVR